MEYHISLLIRKRKSGAFSLRSFRCADKPGSVEGGHLSGMTVASHLERFSQSCRAVFLLIEHTAARPSTTLHAGRNFAVAPRHTKSVSGYAPLSRSAQTPLEVRRLCSHPSNYSGGRYPLPFCSFRSACPDFPPSRRNVGTATA